jgi:hypothetical protein
MTTTATPTLSRSSVIIEVGGLPIQLNVDNPLFLEMLGKRYAGFVGSAGPAKFEFEIDLVAPGVLLGSEEVQVTRKDGLWRMERGDFCAVWNPALACGRIRQTANPYSLDCVLRIVHTLLLAREDGFLVHASSAVRNGRAFLFAGVSGAGKTTMASLAPPDVALLTDEISYVTRWTDQYFAFGTPFAGELARPGENMRAPIAALYLLAKGRENKIESIGTVEAVRGLLEDILFFAKDRELVNLVFQAACDFVGRVPVKRLTFVPDARVWEMIG